MYLSKLELIACTAFGIHMKERTVLAFLITPLVPAAVEFLYEIISSSNNHLIVKSLDNPQNFYMAVILAMIFYCYIAIVLVGLPAYIIFNRKGIYTIGPYLLVGIITSLFIMIILFGFNSIVNYKKLIYFSAFGIITSATFWFIAKPQKNIKADSGHP